MGTGQNRYRNQFSQINERIHTDRRKIINSIYSMSSVLKWEQHVDTCVEMFLKRMGDIADGIENAVDKCVIDREKLPKEERASREDIVGRFFQIHQEKGEKLDFTIDDIKTEVHIAFQAGSDTTSAALTAILYYLMKTLSVYTRLVAEIDEATASSQLSQPRIRFNEATKLPFLVACVKEAMRVHPSVAFLMPRYVPNGGAQVSGEYLSEGTKIGVNPGVILHDKSVFGSDADRYNPDRWFSSDAENMEKHMFQASRPSLASPYCSILED
ncbi:MAG: hypothetical protein M1831_003594 [Alyxoria varia]|nr:MAG: hypothetical protein M1831_003594 [Alyxoria varia]